VCVFSITIRGERYCCYYHDREVCMMTRSTVAITTMCYDDMLRCCGYITAHVVYNFTTTIITTTATTLVLTLLYHNFIC